MTDDLKHIDGEAVVESAVDVFGDVSFHGHKNYTVEQLVGGGYVALWSDDNSAIMGQVYGAEGVDLGGSIETDDTVTGGPAMLSAEGAYPDVAALSDGGFVGAWLNDKVIEYRIMGSDENDGWVLDINMSDIENIGNVGEPSVSALTDGGFVVTWAMVTNSASQNPVNPDISTPDISQPEINKPDLYLQRFAANGDAVAQIQEIPVPDYDLSPDITALPDGGYVLVWNNDTYSDAGSNADSNAGPKFTPIPVQRYDEYNTLAFSTVLLVPRSDYYQTPEITGLTSGGFIVSFAASGSDFGTGTKIHMYDNQNIEIDHFNLGGLVGVEGTTVPQVSALWNGGFIVTWSVNGGAPDVGELGYVRPEIYAQRFDASGQAVDKAPLNLSDLNISVSDSNQIDFGPDNQDGDSSSNNNGDVTEGTADSIDADMDQQQAYVDVNSWITTEDTFDLKDILQEGPLVGTGKISKAIREIFVSKTDKLGRFFASEEPIRNNSVIYVMALYVDQSGYLQFGPIAGLVFLDLNGDLTLTFEEPLVQAVTLSSAFGDLGVSLEIPNDEPGEVTLSTEASIILYDGEALQAYFEQLQNNPQASELSAIVLPDAQGEAITKEGSIELVLEDPDAPNGIVIEEYSVDDKGFIGSENGVFYFAEDAEVGSADQASETAGPLQIDVSYSISAALFSTGSDTTHISASGTSASGSSGSGGTDVAGAYSLFSDPIDTGPAVYGSSGSGDTGSSSTEQVNTQGNEEPPSDETVSATAITEITVELVAIQDINFQGVAGELGERVDLVFKKGVEINPAGDQVSFYIDGEGNLRGEGPDTTKITAELMRSEDGNRITLKFVDGQSGPQMMGKLELESLLKTVLPKHSDVDFDIKITVETTFYGDEYNVLGTASNVDSYTISVDAVADRGMLELTDGVQPDVNAHITISVGVSFDDYADGSEDHAVVLNNVPVEWILLSDSLLISGPTAVPDYPGLVSYQFDVSDLVDAGDGSASLPIEFAPQNWAPPCGEVGPDHGEGNAGGNTGGGSGGNHAEIEVQAIATEANLSGDDYHYGNNVATTVNYFTVNPDACPLFEDENDSGETGPVNIVHLGAGNDTFDDHSPGAEIDLVDGAEGNDTIWTGGGDDILFGAEGNDKLYGEGGNDYLIGGAGDDILRGGSGADGFVFTSDDLGGSDIIRDFRAEQGDTLDLMDLLVDDGSLWTDGGTTSGDNSELATALESYLDISSDGTDTTIVVDADGSEPGTDVATITLQNVDLTLGGSISGHDMIKSLLDNDNLVID